jgi:hypothetical protein
MVLIYVYSDGESTGVWVNLSIFIHNVSKLAKLWLKSAEKWQDKENK